MAQALPSGTNTFVPSMVSENLIVGFSQNPRKFKIAQYVQYIPTTRNQAYYLKIDGKASARLTDANLRNYRWPDGHPRPTAGDNELAEFEFALVETIRRAYPTGPIGQMAIDQATWPIVQVNTGFAAAKAMLGRTVLTQGMMNVSASWGDNTNTAKNLCGGAITSGTPGNKVYRKLLQTCFNSIHLSSFGAVNPEDMVVVLNPTQAFALGNSSEIQEMYTGSPFAKEAVTKDMNAYYGIPDYIYGFKHVVEHAVRVSTKRGASSHTIAYVQGDEDLFMVSRPGGLIGVEGATNFSTLQMFIRKDFQIKTRSDDWNELTEVSICDDYGVYLVAPASGYYIRNALSGT